MSSMIDKSIPPGKRWRIVKSISKVNKNYESLPLLKSSGKLIFHPAEKASVLYKYFAQASTFTDEPDISLHGPGPLPWNVIYKYQYGFRPGDSTGNQLVDIYNTIISSFDKGKDFIFIFCAISKAFDKVWQKGLL